MLDLSNALDQEQNSETEHADRFQSRETFYFMLSCHLRSHLQGPGQIFAPTNFVLGPPVYMDPCKFCCSGVYTDPCKA